MTVEYKISGKWTKYPGKAVGKDSFYHLIALPKATEDVRIHLVETDDGRPSVSRTVNTTLTNTVAVPIGHSNDFKGKIKLYARDSSAWLKDGGEEIVAIEYRQKKCYDGILNYNCEYSLKIEALKKDGRLHVMEGNEHFLNGSFMVFAQVPKDVIGLRLSLSEKDHRNLSASEEIYLDLRHGNSMDIRSWQGIFEGNFKIKFFDYDEAKYGAEGDTDFIPHKQRFREQIIYKFIP